LAAAAGNAAVGISAKATLTGFSHIGAIWLFRCMCLGDVTFSMPDWTPAELAKAALEARR